MSVLVSHPTGNANVRAVLRALAGREVLDSFWTALAIPRAMAASPLLSGALRREISRRCFDEVPGANVHTQPIREIVRLTARTLGWRRLIRHEVGWASVDGVYQALDRRVAAHIRRRRRAPALRAVYAYEDGALETFRAAEPSGVDRIYELPIAHWRTLRRLLSEEAELQPAWAATMEGLADSPAKLARKDEEIALADRIVVPSNFTRESLVDHFGPDLAIDLAPYGGPAPYVTRPRERRASEPLHIAFVGHLSQRKGLAYLIAALHRLDVAWRLTLAGSLPSSPPPELDALLADPRCRWLGHVPHAGVLEAMAAAHVFVLPSLVEGLALVLREAMAAGLPVITTPNAAGPDVLSDGIEGFIVPIRDPDAIATRLGELYADEPRRQTMAAAALACAAAATWRVYEERIARIVEGLTG